MNVGPTVMAGATADVMGGGAAGATKLAIIELDLHVFLRKQHGSSGVLLAATFRSAIVSIIDGLSTKTAFKSQLISCESNRRGLYIASKMVAPVFSG